MSDEFGIVPYEKRVNAMKDVEREIETKLKHYPEQIVRQIGNEFVELVERSRFLDVEGGMTVREFLDYVLKKYGPELGYAWILYEMKSWYEFQSFFKPDKKEGEV
jgi:hypothetical protein